MAIGIKEFDNIYREYSIPLIWDDKKVLAAHLRKLADYIDDLSVPILEIKLTIPIEYSSIKKPCLEVITFKE